MAHTELGPPPTVPAPARLAVADSAHVERIRRRAVTRRRAGRVGLYLLAVGAALVAALPFIWGTITVHLADASGRDPRPAGLDLVARPHLPDDHDPGLVAVVVFAFS